MDKISFCPHLQQHPSFPFLVILIITYSDKPTLCDIVTPDFLVIICMGWDTFFYYFTELI